MSRSRPGTRPGTNTSSRSRAPSTGGPRPPSSPSSNTSTSPTPKSSGSPLTQAQKNKLIEEAIMEEEENGPGKHRIGAVYADPEVRRMLANGQGPTRHAELLKSKYLDLIDQRNQRREKARRYRRNVGRAHGPDSNVQARKAERQAFSDNPTEEVAAVLTDACAALFPTVGRGGRRAEHFASDIPSGTVEVV